ncbi:helix-turn-helix domain-containing protein, partial [Salmonella enterica]|nr:hypothetical protein [Salmonella enterica]ECY6821961.1 helix-turn-helix domain-containing protein [Salmonella enterica]EDZ5957178.1 helix-turn-helix domain-containing protein [Salmonella enterica]
LEAILNIHRHFIEGIPPATITAGKTVDIRIDNQSHILLITKGAIKACRRVDGIVIGSGVSPMILGLVDAYADLYQLEEDSDVFFIAETTCEYYPVPVKYFVEIADEKHLWRDISNILMYRIAFMTNRDKNLIGQDAYSQIKALLLELWSYPESSRFEINAQNFIQQRTGLSRSRIMQVLSELKAGNYIKILHGRLLELRNLPVSF